MILTEQQIQSVVTGFVCDRCGKVVSKKDDAFEHQEGHHITFTGGYASVFGDDTSAD